ncbi:MAG: HAMP domain-containing histidine kinase [Desulfobulbaceae bacterium]|nr:HAMP domain-containing histidine kinase [Desulfobulbaceae bacterium]
MNDDIFFHSDGHQIPVSYVASPTMQGSATTGTVNLFQDTTLRMHMEKTLVRAETMSTLSDMVAGVAHEVNTPIGVSVTAASYLATETTELSTAFKEDALTRSALEDYLGTAHESTTIILSNLERAAKLIKSFKQVAADQASEAKSHFNLKEYIKSVLLTLRPELKKTALTVTVHCPDDIQINSYPGALSQVITNLVVNSKIHAFDQNEAGSLTFDIEKSGDNIHILYSDNGKGISEQHQDDVFAPFFTTRRGKGSSGLGLHITQNLVHTVLKGTITVSSKLNKGTQFTLIIPSSPI